MEQVLESFKDPGLYVTQAAALLDQGVKIFRTSGVDFYQRIPSGVLRLMPEARERDSSIIAHERAASLVYRAATVFLRGSDFWHVQERPPILIETTGDLWRFYEGLGNQLSMRPDLVCILLGLISTINSTEKLERDRHPWLCRFLDLYSSLFCLQCIFPTRFYFYVHKAAWAVESSRAAKLAPSPSPALANMHASLASSAESVVRVVSAATKPISAKPPASSGSSSGLDTSFLLAASCGVGIALFFTHFDGKRRLEDAWNQLQPKKTC